MSIVSLEMPDYIKDCRSLIMEAINEKELSLEQLQHEEARPFIPYRKKVIKLSLVSLLKEKEIIIVVKEDVEFFKKI